MPRRGELSGPASTFEAIRADYAAARDSRFRRTRTGVPSMGSGADYHYRSERDYLKLMELARDMDRNDTVTGPIVDQACTNMLGADGMQLCPMTGDKGLDRELKTRWWVWGSSPEACDVSGENCWPDFEWSGTRQPLVDGDCLVLLTDDGKLEMIEGHRLRSPTEGKGSRRKDVVHGVRLDRNRRRLEYWLTKDDIDPMAQVRPEQIVPYPARVNGQKVVCHIRDPKRKRWSQTRGVTALAPVFDCLGMLEDVNFAKLVQQQVASSFAVFKELDVDAPPPGPDEAYGAESDDTLSDGSTRTLTGVGPGMIVRGRPGEKLTGFSPNVPNQEYFQHVRLILQLIGINLGLPLVIVLMDASETNFSGWRGAIDQARQGFRRNQRWLTRQLHTPVYAWKAREWAAEDGAIGKALAKKSGTRLFDHIWKHPSWPYIEPLKDASTDLLRLRNGLTSSRRLHSERGDDYDDIYPEIIADNGDAIEAAIVRAEAINKKHPKLDQKVSWREVLSLPTPDGVTVTLGDDGGNLMDGNKPAKNKAAKKADK